MEQLVFRLPDGRQLAALRHGPSGKSMIVFFHGTGNSGAALTPDTSGLQDRGIGMLLVQRPGVGESTPLRGFSVGQLVQDVYRWLNALKVEKVYLLTYSSGASYALAFARAYAELVSGIGLISPVFPGRAAFVRSIPGVRYAWEEILLRGPVVDALFIRWLAIKVERQAEAFFERWIVEGPMADRVLYEQIHRRVALLGDLREAWKYKGQPVLDDLKALWRSQEIIEVDMPVTVWQGASDPAVNPENTRLLQSISRQTKLVHFPHLGRLMYLDQWPQIQQYALDALAP